jgi:hypothetical protein
MSTLRREEAQRRVSRARVRRVRCAPVEDHAELEHGDADHLRRGGVAVGGGTFGQTRLRVRGLANRRRFCTRGGVRDLRPVRGVRAARFVSVSVYAGALGCRGHLAICEEHAP